MVLCVSLVALSAAAAQAANVPATAQIDTRLSASRGALSISDSLQGRAVLNAANLAPGDAASGVVSVLNKGPARGTLTLAAANLASPPGRGGGSLASALQVRIEDRTAGGATVFAGPLDTLHTLLLGGLAPAQRRSYRFTATLPPQTGNEYAGASTRVDFAWSATVLRSSAPCATLFRGDSRGERLLGTVGGDRILAGAGDDVVRGLAGPDCLLGQRGDDRIYGGPGRDRIFGGSGDDRIDAAGGGRDLVDCGPGIDHASVDALDRVSGCEFIRRR
jgi:RTX calcium-binding nonapeptide repeat (4 copies)